MQSRVAGVSPLMDCRQDERRRPREYPVALRFACRYVDRSTAEDVVQTVFTTYWEGYTPTPPLVFRADGAHTQAAILVAVRNQLRSHADRAKIVKRKRRHVRAELAERRREAAAPERHLATQDHASSPDRAGTVTRSPAGGLSAGEGRRQELRRRSRRAWHFGENGSPASGARE